MNRIDHLGQTRLLVRNGPQATHRAKFAHMSSVYPLVPRDQWVQIDRRPLWGNQNFILDQMQHGSCVGYSAAGATMRSRALAGQKYARLSGSYIYSWINGGQDKGASIVDAMQAMLTHGTCLDSTCPVNSIYRSQSRLGDAEAKRFLLAKAYGIDDNSQATAFDWVMSAIQCGLFPQFAIQVGDNFEQFSLNGVAGFSPGFGNHSVIGDGALNINGKWYIPMPNSWSVQWGPFRNGYCLLSEEHIMGVVRAGGQDAFVHLDERLDPNDTTNPQPI